jgi:hypothetical protein
LSICFKNIRTNKLYEVSSLFNDDSVTDHNACIALLSRGRFEPIASNGPG